MLFLIASLGSEGAQWAFSWQFLQGICNVVTQYMILFTVTYCSSVWVMKSSNLTISKCINISDYSVYFPKIHSLLKRATIRKYFVHAVAGVGIASVSSQLGMIWVINTTTWKTHRSMLLKWIVLQTLLCALSLASEDTLRKYKRRSGPVSFCFSFPWSSANLLKLNF